jgi:hypothetical protein
MKKGCRSEEYMYKVDVSDRLTRNPSASLHKSNRPETARLAIHISDEVRINMKEVYISYGCI